MNPTAKLADIRQIIAFMLDSKGIPTESDYMDLAIFARQLDEHLSQGGSFPDQWKVDNRSLKDKAEELWKI